MDGPTATKAIRSLGFRNPVLGVTGNGQDFDVATFLASGANKVLTRHRLHSGGALRVSDALFFPLSTIRCSPSRWT
jgi:hypothetical protein